MSFCSPLHQQMALKIDSKIYGIIELHLSSIPNWTHLFLSPLKLVSLTSNKHTSNILRTIEKLSDQPISTKIYHHLQPLSHSSVLTRGCCPRGEWRNFSTISSRRSFLPTSYRRKETHEDVEGSLQICTNRQEKLNFFTCSLGTNRDSSDRGEDAKVLRQNQINEFWTGPWRGSARWWHAAIS